MIASIQPVIGSKRELNEFDLKSLGVYNELEDDAINRFDSIEHAEAEEDRAADMAHDALRED